MNVASWREDGRYTQFLNTEEKILKSFHRCEKADLTKFKVSGDARYWRCEVCKAQFVVTGTEKKIKAVALYRKKEKTSQEPLDLNT